MTLRTAILLLSTAMLMWSAAAAQQLQSQARQASRTGPHGGTMHISGDYQFEVVSTSKAVQVFAFDRTGQPVRAGNVRGRVALSLDGDHRTHRYDLYPQSAGKGSLNGLYLAIDLSRVPDGAATVDFALYGLASRPVSFAAKFKRTLATEQIAISNQRICPVSGKRLGSMGKPAKLTIGGRDVYVCCAGCTNALKENSNLYLAKLVQRPAKATKADSAAINNQKTCPVMDEPLNSMGGAWKVSVDGRDVFVCCKGCIKLVQREPHKYLAKIPTVAATPRASR